MTIENRRLLRDAFGTFMTGVTVVTTLDAAGEPLGFTANSFSSVSLDPPLVLWSPARKSRRFPAFEAASHFAVHVLSDETGEVSFLARRAGNADKFLAKLDDGAGWVSVIHEWGPVRLFP